MNWDLVGWITIAAGAVLLVGFWIVFKFRKAYPVRQLPEVEAFKESQTSAMEQGKSRQMLLGQQLWSRTYPGLGLNALSLVPKLVNMETAVDGGMTISAGDGSLVLLARQVVQNCYQDGFSTDLTPVGVRASLPGPTPLSLTAGLMPELSWHPQGSMALLGNYEPSALLLAESVRNQGGFVLGAAGTLAAQAALFSSVRALLIGESVFMMPGLMKQNAGHQASWLVEDILRFLLILGLLAGVILKMVGVL